MKVKNEFLIKEKRRKQKIVFFRILLFCTFILIWEIASEKGWIDSFYFSSPLNICQLFKDSITTTMVDSSLFQHIGITLLESGISFLLIMLLSIIIATLFWFFPSVGNVFEPFLIVLNSLPKSALAPLIIVWMGSGIKTIIFCGISVGIFGCILTIYQAFSETDPERIKLIETFGGTRLQIFSKIVLPGCISVLLSASKVNLGLALVGVIIGEFLSGRKGLGYLIIYGSQVFKLDLVIMSIIILCIIAMLLYVLITIIQKRLSALF